MEIKMNTVINKQALIAVRMADKTLFENEWKTLKETDDGYVYEDNTQGIGVLPFRVSGDKVEYMVRYEKNPILGEIVTIVTGRKDEDENRQNWWIDTAARELQEEAGIDISGLDDIDFRIIDLGEMFIGKSHKNPDRLMAIDVTGLDQKEPETDGTIFEKMSSNIWVDEDELKTYSMKEPDCYLSAIVNKYFLQKEKKARKQSYKSLESLKKKSDKKFNSTTIQTGDVPEEVQTIIGDVQKSTPKEKLYYDRDIEGQIEDGLMLWHHITLLWGVEDNQEIKDEITNIFKKYKGLEATLSGIDYWDDEEKGYTIAFLNIDSDMLYKLHEELKKQIPNKDTQEFRSHMTIAYLKLGERLDDVEIDPITWKIDVLEISKPNGEVDRILIKEGMNKQALHFPEYEKWFEEGYIDKYIEKGEKLADLFRDIRKKDAKDLLTPEQTYKAIEKWIEQGENLYEIFYVQDLLTHEQANKALYKVISTEDNHHMMSSVFEYAKDLLTSEHIDKYIERGKNLHLLFEYVQDLLTPEQTSRVIDKAIEQDLDLSYLRRHMTDEQEEILIKKWV